MGDMRLFAEAAGSVFAAAAAAELLRAAPSCSVVAAKLTRARLLLDAPSVVDVIVSIDLGRINLKVKKQMIFSC